MQDYLKYLKEVKKGEIKNKCFVSDLYIFSLILKYDIELEVLFYQNTFNYKKEAKDLLDSLLKKAKKVINLPIKTINNLKDKENSIEILGIINLNNHTFNDLLSNVLLILDGIEIPGNLGTILRSCDATNINDIIIINEKTKIENPKVLKSSRGMLLKNNIVVSNFNETIDFLKSNSYQIVLGEPNCGISFEDFKYPKKFAIVFGNERFGIDERWYDLEYKGIYIPMSGEITSLNVSIAASIILYDIARNLKITL